MRSRDVDRFETAARSIFRRVLAGEEKHSEDALTEAVIEWYAQLSRMQQLLLEDLCLEMIAAVKQRNPVQQFGPKQALAVIGALVAFREGWVRYGREF